MTPTLSPKQYFAVPGSRVSNKTAEQVGPEIERLQAKHGERFTAEAMVDEAADPASPIHPHLEWDDEKAGRLYRHSQARCLLDGIRWRVVAEDGSKTEGPIAIAVRVAPREEVAAAHERVSQMRAYLPPIVVASSPELADQAIEDAARAILAYKRRYERIRGALCERYPAFQTTFSALDELEREMTSAEPETVLVGG